MSAKQGPEDIDPSHTSDQCQWLEQCKSKQIVPRGTMLVTCGVAPDHLVILCSGSVEICLPAAGTGETITVGTACKGAVFGMYAIVSGELPETTVTCLEECCVGYVSKEAFLEQLSQGLSLYSNVIKILSAELTQAVELLRRKAGS